MQQTTSTRFSTTRSARAAKAQQASRPRRLEQWRLWTVLTLFALFGVYNAATLFSLQVVQHQKLTGMAEDRIYWKDVIAPVRGLIYDSRGQLLAGNTTADDVYVDKSNLYTPAPRNSGGEPQLDEGKLHAITDLLGPALGQDPQDLFTRLKEAPGTNVRIASRISADQTAKIRQLIKDNSKVLAYKVQFESQPKRQYPNASIMPGSGLAASVLGFTDYDNQGHYGIEEYYNSKLAGQAGWILAEHDAEGRPLVLQQPQMQAAEDGTDLVLTIDSAVQYMAERELYNSIQEYKADSGYLIVQDPNTGGILAMANYPSFNPNDFNKVTDYGLFRNPVVSDMREPGSTMKILTYSSSIDAGAILSTTTVYDPGYVVKYGVTLHNATSKNWGTESMLDGLGRSNNVAAMFAAEMLGSDAYYRYIKSFGIGQRTGIDLSGEVAGVVRWPGSEGYSPIDFYEAAFGQSAAVTPVQLVTAVSAVANGGTLLKPYVMKEMRQEGKVIQKNDRTEIRRVIKPDTAQQVANMMSNGVEQGMVARLAAVPGYHVSVKTGTADVISENGGYTGYTFASAMGFAPSQNPRFTLYIGLMHPRTSPWGENTASVSWGRLARQLLMYMKVQPTMPLPTPTATP